MAIEVNAPQNNAARPIRKAANVQRPAATTSASLRRHQQKDLAVKPFNMPFENINIMGILLGVAVIALSYALMVMTDTLSNMALVVAPILFVVGYCVIVPMGIMAGRGEKPAPQNEQQS